MLKLLCLYAGYIILVFTYLKLFILTLIEQKYNNSIIHLIKIMLILLFLLNIVFVAASKPKAKRNKAGFILYALDSPPLNSCVKNTLRFEFLFYSRFDIVN